MMDICDLSFSACLSQERPPSRLRSCCRIPDNVRVSPADLGNTTLEAVQAELEKSYIDKVIKDVGLAVTIYDITSIEGGFIYHSDGAAHFTVEFSLVIFRPLTGEVLTGNVKRCTSSGIWVTLNFFEDIFVPDYNLQQPSTFDAAEKQWLWKLEEGELPIVAGDPVRLRVVDIKFQTIVTAAQLKLRGETTLGTKAQPLIPMEIVGAMDSDGLGCTAWWVPDADDMEQ